MWLFISGFVSGVVVVCVCLALWIKHALQATRAAKPHEARH